MPLPNIPVPQFPLVPALSGVPQLVRSALNFPPNTVSLGTGALQNQLAAAQQNVFPWGVFDSSGNQTLKPDSILNLDNRNEWKLSDYPVQVGSFASYNKVIVPYEVSLRFSKGGDLGQRAAFLKSIDDIAGDTNLYSIVTPERTYLDVNITRYEVTRRGAEGAYFLCEIDVYFRQILQVTPQYSSTAANTSNAQNPAAVPPVNQGNLQPSDFVPTSAQQTAASAISQTPN